MPIKRYGGSAAPNTSELTDGTVMQFGTITCNGSGLATLVFPKAFDSAPMVTATVQVNGSYMAVISGGAPTTTGCEFKCFSDTGAAGVTLPIHWIAIGT